MWSYLINDNPGTGILLIICGLFVGTGVLGILLWEPINWLYERFYTWLYADQPMEPDCTVTETGVGVVEPWQISQDRDEWEELLSVFDCGGNDDEKAKRCKS